MRSSWRTVAVKSLVAACAFLTPLAASLDAALAQQKKPSHRTQRQGMFALSQMETAPVVMLGDSLTEGAQWAEITGCAFLANRGIGGDDTAGVLKRLDGVTTLKPAAVFLMIGVNDVNSGVSTDTIVENTEEIIDKLKKAGVRVYLSPVLPVADSFTKKINPKIDELNRAYLKSAKEAKIQVIDFRADMRNADGFLKDEFSRDGIHLTAEGYRVWRDAVSPLVQQHCAARPAPAPQMSAPKPGRIDTTPTAATKPPATVPAASAPAPGKPAPSGEFNTRFGPWR
jgi:lysophospholipase L1-like esterase